MSRYHRFKLLSHVRDEYVVASMPDGLRSGKGKRSWETNPFVRFVNSGWGVACICALVALSVVVFILRAGQDPVGPPIFNTPEETTSPTDPSTESDSENLTTSPYEEETEPVILPPDIAQKTYGEEFAIYYTSNFLGGSSVWFEDGNDEGVNAALYEAVKQTETHLGVDIKMINFELAGVVPALTVEPAGTVDLLLIDTTMAISLMSANHLMPFNDIESARLDEPYWDQDLMETLSVDGHWYLGQNHFIPDDYPVIGYHKTLLASLVPDFDAYDICMNRSWTYEKLLTTIRHASDLQDDRGNAYVGFSMPDSSPQYLMLTGADLHITSKNEEGKYVYALRDHMDRLKQICDDTKAFMENAQVAVYTVKKDDRYPDGKDGSINLSQGYVMFQQLKVNQLSQARQMKYMSSVGAAGQTESIDLGVMPIPLYDTMQTDYTAYRTGAFLALPANSPDTMMTGEVMALLAYHGTAARAAYYTDMLGKTPEEAPEDHEILRMLSRRLGCHLWDFPSGFHSDFCGSMLVENFSWNVKENNYRHYFENTYKKISK